MLFNKTNNLKKKFVALIAIVGISVFLTVPSTISIYADYSRVEAFGTDTIAGDGANIRASQADPFTNLTFEVIKPSGETVTIPYQTDYAGNAELTLYDYHTTQAGTYQVTAWLENEAKSSNYNIFKIYPGTTSNGKSDVAINKQTAEADGEDSVLLTVQLKDEYENIITNNKVSVISSKAEDTITELKNSSTDLTKSFLITSKSPGVSTYTVVDMNTGTTLNDRVKVVYFDTMEETNLFTYVAANGDDDSGEATTILIEDLPNNIGLNEDVSFTVTAYDEDGNIAANYSGTVRFSTTDELAVLPDDYTFVPEDMGQHEFDADMTGYEFKFFTSGTQKIFLNDTSNLSLEAEAEINVQSAALTDGAEGLSLDNPVSGTYSNNVQTVSGEADPGSTIVIYDNNQEIGTTDADIQGTYIFNTPPLVDGEHVIYVTTVDSEGNAIEISNEVSLMIDTTAPEIDQLTLEPDEAVQPGSSINLGIYSEPDLSTASLIFNDQLISLTADGETLDLYKTTLVAPEEEGTYSIDIILADELGNETTFNDYKEIVVSTTGITPGNFPPSRVRNVSAIPGDQRVTLMWDEASDETYIQNYRIYFGTSEDNLSSVADTYTSDTTWYIPNLKNGTEYFFAVSAVDSDGNESDLKSIAVSAIPGSFDPSTQIDEGPTPEEMPIPDETSPTGPEFTLFLAMTIVFTEIYFRTRKYLKNRV